VAEAFLREAGDRERGQRARAHRIDVAQRIGGRDLPVDVRVVDDRREEIDGLDERGPTLPGVDAGVVGVAEIDQDARIGFERDVAQDLGELAWGELARSAGAADHLGQPLRSGCAHGILEVSRPRRISGAGAGRATRVCKGTDFGFRALRVRVRRPDRGARVRANSRPRDPGHELVLQCSVDGPSLIRGNRREVALADHAARPGPSGRMSAIT
jgi:hypothetical protein